jgi:GntP family gluconate:H+ symporter
LVAILLLALRPLFGIVIDPMVALPIGGFVTIIATRSWKLAGESVTFGLEKMSVVAILLVGTGTIAGVIKASEIKDVLIALLSGWEAGGVVMAPVSAILMSAATASTTAGATISSASFSQTVLAAGVSSIWAASMTNAGATVLDHLPHGSFFHATGGSVGMSIKERMRLIPYESLVGLLLTILSLSSYLIIG